MKTILELQREGATEASASNKLIEPVPRTIGGDVRWLLNRTTGYIELNHPLLAMLGDTVFEEYEPSNDELARLKMGQRVMGMSGASTTRRIDLSAAPSMKRPLAQEAKHGLVEDIFGDLPSRPEPVRVAPHNIQLAQAQAAEAQAAIEALDAQISAAAQAAGATVQTGDVFAPAPKLRTAPVVKAKVSPPPTFTPAKTKPSFAGFKPAGKK